MAVRTAVSLVDSKAAYWVVPLAVLWVSEKAGRLAATLVAQRVAWWAVSRAGEMAVRTAVSLVGYWAACWVVLSAVRWGAASALASALSEQQSQQ